MKALLVLLAFVCGLISHAYGQVGQMPANTVLGNNTGVTLPLPNALTMTQLLGQFAITGAGNLYGAQGSFWTDLTDVDGTSNARIHQFRDRVMVDDGALQSGAWASGAGGLANSRSGTAINAATWNWASREASLQAINSWGEIATLGISVASSAGSSGDPHSSGGQATIGVAGFGLNDRTTGLNSSWGGYFESLRKTGSAGTALAIETDVGNVGAVVDINPFSSPGGATGLTSGLWTMCGGSSGTVVTYTNCSTGMYLGNNGARWRKGIVVANGGLDTSLGAGGDGVAIELASGQSLRWLNSGGTTVGEIWVDAQALKTSGGFAISGTGDVTMSRHLIGGGGVPPVLTSGCGAGASISGTDALMRVNTGTGAGTCLITYNETYINVPDCLIGQNGSSTPAALTTNNPSSFSFSANSSANYIVFCAAQPGG